MKLKLNLKIKSVGLYFYHELNAIENFKIIMSSDLSDLEKSKKIGKLMCENFKNSVELLKNSSEEIDILANILSQYTQIYGYKIVGKHYFLLSLKK